MGWFLTAAVWAQTNQSISSSHHEEIPATDAKKHIHEFVTVYGKVCNVVSFQTGRYVKNVLFEIDGYGTNRPFGIGYLEADNNVYLQLKSFKGQEISVSGEIKTNRYGSPGMNIKSVDEISIWKQRNQSTSITQSANPFDQFDSTNAPSAKAATPAIPDRAQTSAPPATNKIPSWFAFTIDPSATNTIVTATGKTYHHAKVVEVEPDGLTIKFSPDGYGIGEVKIPFEDLPLDIQQHYGYDSQNAVAYTNQKKQEAIQVEAEKQRQEAQERQEELEAEKAAAQILYDQAKQAYAQAKEDYDRQMQLASLQAQQKAALAQTMQAREAARQTALMKLNSIIQQQQLYEMQNQTYQQQRTADEINNLNQQVFINRLFGR